MKRKPFRQRRPFRHSWRALARAGRIRLKKRHGPVLLSRGVLDDAFARGLIAMVGERGLVYGVNLLP